MRKFVLLTLTTAFTATLFAAPLAQARHALAGSTPVVAATTEPTAPATTVIRGKVVSPAGILPGAVVKLRSTQQLAVANAEGEFQLAVLADGGPQVATVSFAGFEDEEIILNPSEAGTKVSLAKVHFIKVKRNQSLKVYMKTARKQSRKASRSVRR
ncbi:hypothetical protein Q5H93_20405 [Hymenobacter sp. ASUV-10]|uniref:Carboxypeptidase-like regulatory domain-containing protein n=1 Tax=Hymenobacter aranciens TaxID=3063996 RepID=A0ABT9BHD0_9BACT|nr:hypothetical protein [Hymenobacter sp. ASUV-10]MDO7877119.1 hypothetical protein [Hymenobacter sp. ASUV-10]